MSLEISEPRSRSALSIIHGSKQLPIWKKTIASLIDEQAQLFGEKPAIIFPWQSVRISYRRLSERSIAVAKAMLSIGLQKGDCIGIMAGNRYEYIEIFLGAGRIGCPSVVLNNTYSPEELINAVSKTCRRPFRPTRGSLLMAE
jgi:mevalonyl-CoA ligase